MKDIVDGQYLADCMIHLITMMSLFKGLSEMGSHTGSCPATVATRSASSSLELWRSLS